MRSRVPDMPLALTMLWIWIGIVAVSIACWWLLKWWKRRHPPPAPEPVLPYSQRLRKRLNEHRLDKRTGHHGDTASRHGK